AVTVPGVERDQVEVDRVEHGLDAHEDEDRVAPSQHAVDANGEGQRRDQERIQQGHQPLPPLSWMLSRSRRRARAVDNTIAPTRAASKSTDKTSNGNTQVAKTAVPIASAPPMDAPARSMTSPRKPATSVVPRTPATASATIPANHALAVVR